MLKADIIARGKDPRMYNAWGNMRARCNNPRNQDFHNYGARGITVCKRWDSFAAFASDMGPHPGKGWTLDRKETNGDYEKDNCRWATPKIQRRNQRFGPKLKLTAFIVGEIKRRYKPGINQTDRGNCIALAAEFNIHRRYLPRIAAGTVWQ